VAETLGIKSYETPTGWKFFGNLLDAGLATVCGEESFGTGSNHVREKDGLWAVLCWLSVLAAKGKSVEDIVREHWRRFGRSYYQRHDYEALNAAAATSMVAELRENLNALAGTQLAGGAVARADDFSYTDPVDGSTTAGQGIRIFLEDGSRVVLRLSGTGTSGATLRIYLERFRDDGGDADISEVLSTLTNDVRGMLRLRERFGTDEPTVIT
jgi:phosphoglucomutase